jgi:hypothetical protein
MFNFSGVSCEGAENSVTTNLEREDQGCQMAYFQTKNPNLSKFWSILQWKILLSFGLFYGHLVYLMAISYILWLYGVFFPVLVCCTKTNLAALAKILDYLVA